MAKNIKSLFEGEYMRNAECTDPSNCPPCEQRFPSCMGLSDGNNTFPVAGKEQLYLVCKDGRTMAVESCSSGTFDALQGMCTSEFDLSRCLISEMLLCYLLVHRIR